MLQLNHTQAPFNNPKVRQALAMAIDQSEFLKSAVSDPAMMKPCYGYYGLDSPYLSEEGADVLKVKSVDKAKAALKEAGYNGEPVVILGVMDNPISAAMCQMSEDLLRRLGMNPKLVSMDFATMAQRRVSREPTDKGGWSLFVTAWTGADIANPAVHQMLRAGGKTSWFGWPDDPEMESLRDKWAVAPTPRGAEEARDRAAGPGVQDAAVHPARLADPAGRLPQERDRRVPDPGRRLLEHRQESMTPHRSRALMRSCLVDRAHPARSESS